MEKFASVYQSDYTQKQEASKLNSSKFGQFNQMNSSRSTDLESQQIKGTVQMNNSTASSSTSKSGVLSFFNRSEPTPAPAPPAGFLGKLFSHLPTEKKMSKAFISFGICALLLLISLVNIFTIITSPGKFVCIFTMAVIAAITGLAQWNGPQAYMNRIFEKQNLVRTVTLFASMFLALWFSLVNPSYILSLFFCVVEFNAIMLYFCNTFPLGRASLA